ncbi:MAG: hypothetical protein RBS17_05875 [Coriobacteriia bacterium]|nr:hypothetical protein [Coriobacteriia bacterium]
MAVRPRISLGAAVAIPAAAYAVRSIVRSSVVPDLPQDAIVFGALLGLLTLSTLAGTTAQHRRNVLPEQMYEHDERSDTERKNDEVTADVQTSDTRGARSPHDG